MKLRDNVDVEKINWRFFAQNPNVQHFNHHTMSKMADKMKGKNLRNQRDGLLRDTGRMLNGRTL